MTYRCLVIGWFGYNNIGDELLLHSFLASPKDGPFEIVVVSGNPQQTERIHGVESIKLGWSILTNLHKSDVIVFGGGQIFSDRRARTIPLWTAFLCVAQVLNRKGKVLIINQGFEAQNKLLQKMLRLSLSKADFISVRDSNSLKLTSQLKLEVPVSFGPDMVFSFTADKKTINPHSSETAEKIIGVNIRPLFWWAHDLGCELSEEVLASVLDQLIEQRNVKIVFVPFRLSGKEGYSDQEASEVVISKMKHKQKATVYVCPLDETLFSSIEACYNTFDFFIGTALHSLILSCKLGIPFIALPYQKKCEMLMNDLGLKEFTLNSDELLSANSLLARILRAFDERQKTKASLSSLSEELRASSAQAHLSFSLPESIYVFTEGAKNHR